MIYIKNEMLYAITKLIEPFNFDNLNSYNEFMSIDIFNKEQNNLYVVLSIVHEKEYITSDEGVQIVECQISLNNIIEYRFDLIDVLSLLKKKFKNKCIKDVNPKDLEEKLLL